MLKAVVKFLRYMYGPTLVDPEVDVNMELILLPKESITEKSLKIGCLVPEIWCVNYIKLDFVNPSLFVCLNLTLHRILLHTSFLFPMFISLMWVRPIARDYLCRVAPGKTEPM